MRRTFDELGAKLASKNPCPNTPNGIQTVRCNNLFAGIVLYTKRTLVQSTTDLTFTEAEWSSKELTGTEGMEVLILVFETFPLRRWNLCTIVFLYDSDYIRTWLYI